MKNSGKMFCWSMLIIFSVPFALFGQANSLRPHLAGSFVGSFCGILIGCSLMAILFPKIYLSFLGDQDDSLGMRVLYPIVGFLATIIAIGLGFDLHFLTNPQMWGMILASTIITSILAICRLLFTTRNSRKEN